MFASCIMTSRISVVPLLAVGLASALFLPWGANADPCSPDAHRSFYSIVSRALLGEGYRNLTVESSMLCGRECIRDADRCFSFNYWEGTKSRCELNGATVTRFPLAVGKWSGAYYFGPEKPPIIERLRILARESSRELPGLTDRPYDTQASAAADCNATGQHLCELWEVDQAYAAGYVGILPVDTDIWYAVPDSQAMVTGSGVSQHGLPMNAPAPGICCPGTRLSPRDPIITTESYAKDDIAGQVRGCSELSSHPCMLPELKAAYIRGYRQTPEGWVALAVPNRDAQLFSDGCGAYAGGSECYEGVVANTPRPNVSLRVFCCPNLYH